MQGRGDGRSVDVGAEPGVDPVDHRRLDAGDAADEGGDLSEEQLPEDERQKQSDEKGASAHDRRRRAARASAPDQRPDTWFEGDREQPGKQDEEQEMTGHREQPQGKHQRGDKAHHDESGPGHRPRVEADDHQPRVRRLHIDRPGVDPLAVGVAVPHIRCRHVGPLVVGTAGRWSRPPLPTAGLARDVFALALWNQAPCALTTSDKR